MNLKFEEAARGVNREISVNITDTCPKCDGKRHEPGRAPVTCPACHGTGMVSIVTCNCVHVISTLVLTSVLPVMVLVGKSSDCFELSG